jgi:hypothetical protein
MGQKRNAYKILMGKPEGKRPLGVQMVIREIGWGGMDWINLAQDRDQWMALVNTVMNLRVPKNVEIFLNTCTTGGFSGRGQFYELGSV